MASYQDFRRFDWILLCAALALSVIGIAILSGIAQWAPEWQRLPVRQVQWLAISLAATAVLVCVDYRVWQDWAWPCYALAILALILLRYFGHNENNSTRWFRVGPISVQPSEFAKLAFVFVVARYLTQHRQRQSPSALVAPLLLAAAPMLLILKQPDLGTALLFLPTLFVMLYISGTPVKHLATLALIGLLGLPILWMKMGPAQQGRIIGFLYPEADPFGVGWHVTRSVAATVAGGITGNGFASGSPILLRPGFKAFNDFMFAAVSHELGFIGSMGVLLLFFILLTRATEIAARARDPFGRLVCAGLLTLIATQLVINVGMTIRLCPITGVTLPFMSQGGSSLLLCFVTIALILNVGMRQRPTVAPDAFA